MEGLSQIHLFSTSRIQDHRGSFLIFSSPWGPIPSIVVWSQQNPYKAKHDFNALVDGEGAQNAHGDDSDLGTEHDDDDTDDKDLGTE